MSEHQPCPQHHYKAVWAHLFTHMPCPNAATCHPSGHDCSCACHVLVLPCGRGGTCLAHPPCPSAATSRHTRTCLYTCHGLVPSWQDLQACLNTCCVVAPPHCSAGMPALASATDQCYYVDLCASLSPHLSCSNTSTCSHGHTYLQACYVLAPSHGGLHTHLHRPCHNVTVWHTFSCICYAQTLPPRSMGTTGDTSAVSLHHHLVT